MGTPLTGVRPQFSAHVYCGQGRPSQLLLNCCSFWATVCKTVRPMLSDVVCLSCPLCPVCDVGVLWPNGWMDQDETWRTGRPWPWPQSARWGPSYPAPKRGQSPQFSAHVCCGQMAAWSKMTLGMEVSLDPGHTVLDGAQLLSPKQGADPPIFGPFLL